MKASDEKTNVMRTLDRLKLDYKAYCYVDSGVISGVDVAHVMNQNPDKVFKTLVTSGKSGKNYVFVIPSPNELDLKKAAACVGEKSIEMLKSKDLLPLTGYIHGGCSPIGMKKFFHTVIHKTAADFDTIFFSAGKIGYQVEMKAEDLAKAIKFDYGDLTVQ